VIERQTLHEMVAGLSPQRRALLESWLDAGDEPGPDKPRDDVRLPLVRINSGGAQVEDRPPLFCVHSEGGGAGCYAALSAWLGGDQPVYGLQARGLQDDGEPQTLIEEMAAHYVASIRRAQPRGPYFLAGWCLGGIIGFEMAIQLESSGETVALLALMDAPAPPVELSEYDFAAGVAAILGMTRMLAGSGTKVSLSFLRRLSTEDQLAVLVERLREYPPETLRKVNLLLPAMSTDLLRNIVKVFVANSEAIRQYRPRTYGGRVTFFRATHPYPIATADFVEGWRPYVGESIELCDVDGHHLNFLQEPHVRDVARKLRDRIDRAQRGGVGTSTRIDAPHRGLSTVRTRPAADGG